ncbi:hypothetical protein JCM10908_002962 [Rhodotorula pacifica]|uniref:uncharacterized protein n=1 Tax=Rhodotorula pacifica TaxID=1495444 RepID=UPI00317E476E
MSSSLELSLEPPRLLAGDGLDDDLFARPARLQDLNLEDGREVLTRNDTTKSLNERLLRVWAERGDFSKVTKQSIRNPTTLDDDGDKGKEASEEDKDSRPTVEDVRRLQETMIHSLAVVRGELTTALDLLSVLSTPTDPPDVDINSIPLPQQTLTLVPTAVPPRPSSDPTTNPLAVLPLATSLNALKSSANAFFRASEELIPLDPAEQAALAISAPALARPRQQTRAPDPWRTILRLHAGSPRPLVPLGAMPGASLTGKGETRTARQVGVVYGCPEAREDFRRSAVARVGDLVEEVETRKTDTAAAKKSTRGRTLMLELETKAGTQRTAWTGESGADTDLVERILKDRSRSAFAEELFAQLISEARADASLRAELVLATKSEGDAVRMKGNGWQLRIAMVKELAPALAETASQCEMIFSLGPILRLLFLQTYAHRRSPRTVKPPRSLLASISALLDHRQRAETLTRIMDRQLDRARGAGVERVEVQDGGESAAGDGPAREVELLLKPGEGAFGGRKTLRIGRTHIYHVTHSYPLPTPKGSPATAGTLPVVSEPTLVFRMPGKAPIQVPSFRLLEQLLDEQVALAIEAEKPRKAEELAMEA